MSDAMRSHMQDAPAWSRSSTGAGDSDILRRMDHAGVVRRQWHEMMAEYQPDVLEFFFERRSKLRPYEIDLKVREFLLVAIDAVVAWPDIDSHINAAFEKGATIQELMDVFVAAGNLMGPHAWSFGMSHLDKIIKWRSEAGLPVPRDKNSVRPL
jgi:alkylhydroperoxidase/carboxymuconolactone decarboxylase family protein YurZ